MKGGQRFIKFIIMPKLSKDYNLEALYPDIANEWHPTKNGDLAPDNVTFGSGKKVWWKCEFGHEWKTVVKSISSGSRCPECFNIRKKTNT